VPEEAEITLPEKLSLTSILEDFMSAINNLPIMQTLNGLQIVAGGSSTICMDLPSKWGGSKCINCASWEDELNQVGSVLLSVTTLLSFVGLFRGDA
jgi:hypothetical protein